MPGTVFVGVMGPFYSLVAEKSLSFSFHLEFLVEFVHRTGCMLSHAADVYQASLTPSKTPSILSVRSSRDYSRRAQSPSVSYFHPALTQDWWLLVEARQQRY